jgi:hypothetical protein
MKMYGGMKVEIQAFLTLALGRGKPSASPLMKGLSPPSTHGIGTGCGPRPGFDSVPANNQTGCSACNSTEKN